MATIFTTALDLAVEVSIASATTCSIGGINSNRVLVTGSTTITSFGTGVNCLRFVRFSGSPVLTYNATTLILPSAANITTAAGDVAIFQADASSNWTCIAYTKANGQAISGSTGGSVTRQSYTATAGQTSQAVSGGYSAGAIDVYVNGSKMVNGDDVIVTSGTSITFTIPLIIGDAIDIICAVGASGATVLTNSIRQSLTPSTEGQTVFTVSGGYSPNAIDIYYNGSKLQAINDVTISSGSTITLQFPTTLTDVIDVVGVNVLSSIGTVSRQSFTATAGQTSFTISGGYQANAIDVYQNGVKLQNSVDVTVTSGTSVVLATAASLGDIIDVSASQQSSGNGVCNLGTTQSSTTVTVTSDTGGSAVLPAATTSSAGVLTAADKVSLRNYGMKNRIINGKMDVSQKGATNIPFGAGSIVTTAADRFRLFNFFGSGQINTAISTSVPANSGFTNSLSLTVATPPPLSGASNYAVALIQCIEGYNIADLYTAGSATLSFYVKSSITGTYSICLSNASLEAIGATGRMYVVNYSINAANTWEYKTINFSLITGFSAGTWNTSNGVGLSLAWGLGAESANRSNTYLNTWGTLGTNYGYQSASQTQWATNSGATFGITGVQLELGAQATEFEHRPYGTELALCQRYYEQYTVATGGSINANGYAYSTTVGNLVAPVVMKRAAPTAAYTGTLAVIAGASIINVTGFNGAYYGGASGITIQLTVASGLTIGAGMSLYANGTTCTVAFNAEI